METKEEKIKLKSILQTKDISIKFGNLLANDCINLNIYESKIHAILGENGAGKSTLMKILYGVYKPTSGKIFIDGKETELSPPSNARNHGIGMVFQDFRLINNFTVIENIYLELSKFSFWLNKKKLKKSISDVSDKYHLNVDPDAYVWQLDAGQRQRVEILRVLLMKNTKILIFDEPTSVLIPQEVEAFLKILNLLKRDGYAIILITHKIQEVLSCADVITILRAGKVTYNSYNKSEFNEKDLLEKMLGEKLKEYEEDYKAPKTINIADNKLFEIENLSIVNDYGMEMLSKINFTFNKGEIIGVASISGSGQKELAETLYGVRSSLKGKLILDGRDITRTSTKERIDLGIALVSEDPVKDNIVRDLSILEHMVLSGIPMYSKGLGIDWMEVLAHLNSNDQVKSINMPEAHRKAYTLSGGNIQRMILARALLTSPKVLIACYPSRGLDIGTVKTVHKALLQLKEQGSSIFLISEDLNELFDLSDRLLVLANKTMYGPYKTKDTNIYDIGKIMIKGEVA